jgi:hypothetical protein
MVLIILIKGINVEGNILLKQLTYKGPINIEGKVFGLKKGAHKFVIQEYNSDTKTLGDEFFYEYEENKIKKKKSEIFNIFANGSGNY